jgi:UDP-N-acetylglucosamine 2-epimerase
MRTVLDISPTLVHTGQHYDGAMAGQLFRDLEIPAPDVSLKVGSGSHAYQTAEVMRRLEPVLERIRPDLVLVMALVAGAWIVLTDSGGLQEETTALGIPCLTLRENTERPVTVENGTNRLVGTSPARIVEETHRVIERASVAPPRPPLWDGRAAERIVAILREQLSR